jgi:hypothetical protein
MACWLTDDAWSSPQGKHLLFLGWRRQNNPLLPKSVVVFGVDRDDWQLNSLVVGNGQPKP